MSDDDGNERPALQAAVDQFLDSADEALAEYEQGYADADATVRRLRAAVETLRDRDEE